MSVGIKAILVTVALVSVLALVVAERPQLIRFYTQPDCRPDTATNRPKFYEFSDTKNITNEVSNPILTSYCVPRGAWRVEFTVLQGLYDFNISVGDACATCYNKGNNNKRYGTAQRIGGRDLTLAHISLYPDKDFKGQEMQINGWEFSFDNTYSYASVALSSFNNWTWQAYYLPRFRGSSVCFRPNHDTEMTLISPTAANVGSIRLGCRNSGNSHHHQKIGIIAITIMAFAVPGATILL